MSFLEYAPAPESTAILNLKDSYGLFIDGEFVDGSGTPFHTISPATEKHIARSPRPVTRMSTARSPPLVAPTRRPGRR